MQLFDSIKGAISSPAIVKVIEWLSLKERYGEFDLGIFNFEHIIYFITLIAIINFLTVQEMCIRDRFELCWILYGRYSDDNIRKGWMLLLYQLPLINAIFMPLLSIIVASRLSDIEHKGYMLKQLCCITPKGRLYDAKLVYGLGMVLASLVLQFAGVYIGGKYLGFGGMFPLDLYVLYLSLIHI